MRSLLSFLLSDVENQDRKNAYSWGGCGPLVFVCDDGEERKGRHLEPIVEYSAATEIMELSQAGFWAFFEGFAVR